MINETINNFPTKVVTGELILNHPHLLKAWSINGSTPRHSAILIISKSATETLEKIHTAIEAAIEKGNFGSIENFDRSMLKLPLRDGDIEYPTDELYKNSYFLSATSPIAPIVVDKAVHPVLSDTQISAGEYAKASIDFIPYNFKGKMGISCRLYNVQLLGKSKLRELRPDPRDEFTVEY